MSDCIYFCVRDPQGILVHTTVSTKPEEAIEQWLSIEQGMNWLHNLARASHGERTGPLQSWEGFEAEGYSVVRVKLIQA